jgi:SAM-dependent methyltransferase
VVSFEQGTRRYWIASARLNGCRYHEPMDGSWSQLPAPELEAGPGTAPDPELATTLAAFADLDYRNLFWPGRRYEDQCDRIALRALLPPRGDRLMEVGAGFGRLANEYGNFREVVLLDPSDAMLGGAREQVGDDARFRLVSGDAQRIPLPDRSFDVVVCVRVLHHFQHPRPALAEFARVLRPGGVLVLESANKRNLKAILAYLIGRQRSSPLKRGTVAYPGGSLLPKWSNRGSSARPRLGTQQPDEETQTRDWPATPPSYVHAPKDVRAWLEGAGFEVGRTRSVGLLRPAYLTANLPVGLLSRLERVLQPGLAAVTAGPSIFYRAVRLPDPEDFVQHGPSAGKV